MRRPVEPVMTAVAARRGIVASRCFPGLTESAHAARDFTRAVLAGHPAVDHAELCVTELFANAVAYTRSGWLPGGTVTVTVRIVGGSAVVTVLDQGAPDAPLLADPDGLDEHGRGLRLVNALADDWGTAPDPAGRAVWFRCEGEA